MRVEATTAIAIAIGAKAWKLSSDIVAALKWEREQRGRID
jgi:hypothetical protein